MTLNMETRTAVVVGGSSGMGRAVVNDLRTAGASVVSTSRDPDGSSVTPELRDAGVRIVRADLTTDQGLDELVAAVETVDFLVLSAAALEYRPFRDFPADEAEATVAGKLLGYWRVVHRLAPKLSTD